MNKFTPIIIYTVIIILLVHVFSEFKKCYAINKANSNIMSMMSMMSSPLSYPIPLQIRSLTPLTTPCRRACAQLYTGSSTEGSAVMPGDV